MRIGVPRARPGTQSGHERSAAIVRPVGLEGTVGYADPPAKQAMIDMLNRETQRLKEGRGNAEMFSDVAVLNSTLNKNAETVRLLEEIGKTDSAWAAQCWWACAGSRVCGKTV